MGEGVHELERLTGRQLQRLIEGGISTAVVPFGSVEHHGGHLPLGADAILADAVGAEVARRLGAVLAPTVRVGCSDRHRHLPGTLTFGPETLARLAIEHARALARHGFTLIVLLSAHGGNQAALDAAVTELGASLPGVAVCAPRGDVGHASPDLAREMETATATRGQAPHRALHRQRGR